MDGFVPLKFLSNLLLPPASIAAGLLVGGLAIALGLRRTGTWLALASILQGLILSLPPVGDALMAPLEQEAKAAAELAQPCCYTAIVLLGGAVYPATPPAMPAAHLVEGADRIFRAAELFHEGVAPRIIVSGGRVQPSPSGGTEAEAMKTLLTQLGVPSEAIVNEDRSRNTLDNIAFVHRLVGDQPVALVTSAYHMPRAMKIARAAGLKASAFPTDWQIPAAARPSWDNWLPTIGAERASFVALREYLALAFDERRPKRNSGQSATR